MKNIFRFFLITICWILVTSGAFAREFQGQGTKSSNTIKETAAGCDPGSSSKYLDINNVRTIIYSYGNGWFIENAEYEIPKGSKKTSMFSFSLWIGGIDVNNNLKLAAYRYGQGPSNGTAHTKNDFWPGPLTIDGTGSITPEVCAKYDKLFPITREEVQEFLAWWDNQSEFPDYTIPRDILDWPGNGDRSKGQAFYLAPFVDVDGSGDYDPHYGDYPYYDFANALCPKNLKPGDKIQRAHLRNGEPDDTLGILVDQVIKGDQTLWYVFNDKGNIHSETQGEPIGLEIRGQAFAFATNDEINNMTFYSYEIINRSTYTLTGTYFSQWVDPDLGWAQDDYVGCDVKRGLGYCYNGKPIDGNGQVEAYGSHPPAVGVDFFQGPYMDGDGRDNPKFTGDCSIINSEYPLDQMAINGVNFGDGIVDNERFGMRRFVYHNNNLSGVPLYMQDPDYAPQYYNFLQGIWRDGTKMIWGGNAHLGAGGCGPATDFMFPGDSDPCLWGTKGQPPLCMPYWTEETAGNNPSDRRFMQSAGPFTLNPGACNYITVGIPWARSTGTPFESVELLRIVDDKCQSLFDNCFAVLNGPNAPDLTIEELDKSLIIYLTNRKTNDKGNNFQEKYVEYDPNIPNPDTLPHNKRNDSLYHFEGYQLYQLKDATVSASDIDDPTKCRLVAQCDIQDNITKLVNWTFDQNIGGNVGEVMVDGANAGIQHSFVITDDQFATGDSRLINHKQYYFLAVAYAYNEYKMYQPDSIDKGQKVPYLRGRNNIQVYTAIPHIPVGQVMNSAYGDGPVITRIQGQGNGGMIVDFSDQTIAEIMSKPPADSITNKYGDPNYPISYHPVYTVSHGPLGVKVIDPLNVVSGDFVLKFDSMVSGPTTGNPFTNVKIKFGKWTLYDTKNNQTYYSDTTTIYPYEQLFIDLGLALQINQVPYPGDYTADGVVTPNNGMLYAPTAIYEDSTKIWLGGVQDSDVPASPLNWIRSGTYKTTANELLDDWDMKNDRPWDPNKDFGKIQGGTWAPYFMCAYAQQNQYGPAYNRNSKDVAAMDMLCSVDIVFTPDKTKWTRCPVIEMCPDKTLSEGRVDEFEIRAHRSVNVDGDSLVVSSDPMYNSDYISPTGMSWFPGYAINLETGERLNIMFGENSWLVADNGRDMKFNPTSRLANEGGEPVFGGQHYVYIMGRARYSTPTFNFDFPAYDAGAYLRMVIPKKPALQFKSYTYSTALWVGMPMEVAGKEDQWLSNQVTIKVRVAKPYQRYFSLPLPLDYVDTAANRCWPMYTFQTESIATSKDNHDKSVSDLDLIKVVPNPYYAYDDYERNQLDNRIKIVNLPLKCTVTIFDMSGTMLRQFVVDKSSISEPRSSTDGINTDSKTSIDWDLKNFAGIPISGGVYLIHVKADGLGEVTLKWFGILRPVDLNSF
ncbi:MAG TPA: hypothetical protein VMC08_07735 [Bacteroidales bacterium]|nr:hypothetical protein [Bacteroidales bacterium]